MDRGAALHGGEGGAPQDNGGERADGPWLLGVRHHGPGSARAVREALDARSPRAVLIEGPPEADALVELVGDDGMRPPVALLAHVTDDPARSAFWPLAEFSPEWVALRWAVERGVPARFIDLPAAHSLAGPPEEDAEENAEGDAREHGEGDAREDAEGDGEGDAQGDAEEEPGAQRGEQLPGTHDEVPLEAGSNPPAAGTGERNLRIDPLAVLAETAGYDDPERWWEDVVEHRDAGGDALAPFAALAEAMGALRERYGDGGHARDAVREAYMRLQLRSARKEFGDEVAVVCGAWHVPALAARTTVTADRALLKGLPKAKVDMTWVPWTHRRLSRAGGYGAGIASPGWYAHLFRAPDRPVERWLTKVAGLLRDEDRGVSSAHVIEAVRLAETLAVMRGRPLPGLSETTDAIRAVLCDGSDVPLALVHDQLVVGDVLGEVPESAPVVPLQRDLTRTQRRLRLKPEALERELDLDLRKDTDAERSRLLHRLRLLGIGWGEPPAVARGSTGTFRESWRLRWEPELAVRVAEAGIWGATVLAAATARAESDAIAAPVLADVTALAERCLLAELPDALPTVMQVLADRAALDNDVGHLAQALPALVRSLRYGDVRGTDTGSLAEVAAGLAERVFVGLPPACAGLDADGGAQMRGHVEAVHAAVGLLAEAPASPPPPDEVPPGPGALPPDEAASGPGTPPDGGETAAYRATGIRSRWHTVLRGLGGRDTVPGEVRGRAVRLLLDEGELEHGEAARLMGLALSAGAAPADAAAWIEGFVGAGSGGTGGGMLLIHDDRLLGLVDAWLTSVPAAAFTDVLPLLRRTFSAYETGVRRTLGELVRRGPGGAAGAIAETTGIRGFAAEPDRERADAVLPVLQLLLGLARDADADSDADADADADADPRPGLDPGAESPGTPGPTTRDLTEVTV
ncbi:DUF5682 family protein [Streptomyces sp. B-S-A8]|uniref:DUF5682 family protein n=1 Tax=Streptomyces solicavernae TaxID=3043614 RepID=A0ABT6RMK2_9ACTN|nr:DUF5682 family protein [Streptomyces sp. B-S-A8]MDI3385671.1 DUF5682 family protein [Streptomyces sp. B-S-A8]